MGSRSSKTRETKRREAKGRNRIEIITPHFTGSTQSLPQDFSAEVSTLADPSARDDRILWNRRPSEPIIREEVIGRNSNSVVTDHQGKISPANEDSVQHWNQSQASKSLPAALEDDDRPEGQPPQTLSPKPSQAQVLRALYDYSPMFENDMGFRAGDRMEVIDRSEDDDGDWWFVKNIETGKEGYVPSNYVVVDDNKIETQEWWFDCDRKAAEMLLLLPENPAGTYLIRGTKGGNTFALSVLDCDEVQNYFVRHFRIQTIDDNGNTLYFIAKNERFGELSELIRFYYEEPGLHVCLTMPCPKERPAILLKDFEVNRSDVEIHDEKLGKGNFGEVHAGTFRNSIPVAVKSLRSGGSMTAEDFLREAEVMHQLRHPRLVQLIGVCTESRPILIITERMVNGSLFKYLRRDEAREAVPFASLIGMAIQVADGMSYLEMKSFVHRDLRSENVLVGVGHNVKVADFGLTCLLDMYYELDSYYASSKGEQFPYRWTAPEAISHQQFTSGSDVWSYGVLLYELVTYAAVPYPGLTNHEVSKSVSAGYRMPRPTGPGIVCPEELYRIMGDCWDEKPDRRPTFELLKKDLGDFKTTIEADDNDNDYVNR